jgi:hypothetical protein
VKHAPSNDLQRVARHALALGYAAIDSPTVTRVREAQNLVLRVLGSIDDNLCGGEIGELVKALRAMAAELTGLEPQPV